MQTVAREYSVPRSVILSTITKIFLSRQRDYCHT